MGTTTRKEKKTQKKKDEDKCANLRGLSIEERASFLSSEFRSLGGSVETIAEMALVR